MFTGWVSSQLRLEKTPQRGHQIQRWASDLISQSALSLTRSRSVAACFSSVTTHEPQKYPLRTRTSILYLSPYLAGTVSVGPYQSPNLVAFHVDSLTSLVAWSHFFFPLSSVLQLASIFTNQ